MSWPNAILSAGLRPYRRVWQLLRMWRDGTCLNTLVTRALLFKGGATICSRSQQQCFKLLWLCTLTSDVGHRVSTSRLQCSSFFLQSVFLQWLGAIPYFHGGAQGSAVGAHQWPGRVSQVELSVLGGSDLACSYPPGQGNSQCNSVPGQWGDCGWGGAHRVHPPNPLGQGSGEVGLKDFESGNRAKR